MRALHRVEQVLDRRVHGLPAEHDVVGAQALENVAKAVARGHRDHADGFGRRLWRRLRRVGALEHVVMLRRHVLDLELGEPALLRSAGDERSRITGVDVHPDEVTIADHQGRLAERTQVGVVRDLDRAAEAGGQFAPGVPARPGGQDGRRAEGPGVRVQRPRDASGDRQHRARTGRPQNTYLVQSGLLKPSPQGSRPSRSLL